MSKQVYLGLIALAVCFAALALQDIASALLDIRDALEAPLYVGVVSVGDV